MRRREIEKLSSRVASALSATLRRRRPSRARALKTSLRATCARATTRWLSRPPGATLLSRRSAGGRRAQARECARAPQRAPRLALAAAPPRVTGSQPAPPGVLLRARALMLLAWAPVVAAAARPRDRRAASREPPEAERAAEDQPREEDQPRAEETCARGRTGRDMRACGARGRREEGQGDQGDAVRESTPPRAATSARVARLPARCSACRRAGAREARGEARGERIAMALRGRRRAAASAEQCGGDAAATAAPGGGGAARLRCASASGAARGARRRARALHVLGARRRSLAEAAAAGAADPPARGGGARRPPLLPPSRRRRFLAGAPRAARGARWWSHRRAFIRTRRAGESRAYDLAPRDHPARRRLDDARILAADAPRSPIVEYNLLDVVPRCAPGRRRPQAQGRDPLGRLRPRRGACRGRRRRTGPPPRLAGRATVRSSSAARRAAARIVAAGRAADRSRLAAATFCRGGATRPASRGGHKIAAPRPAPAERRRRPRAARRATWRHVPLRARRAAWRRRWRLRTGARARADAAGGRRLRLRRAAFARAARRAAWRRSRAAAPLGAPSARAARRRCAPSPGPCRGCGRRSSRSAREHSRLRGALVVGASVGGTSEPPRRRAERRREAGGAAPATPPRA